MGRIFKSAEQMRALGFKKSIEQIISDPVQRCRPRVTRERVLAVVHLLATRMEYDGIHEAAVGGWFALEDAYQMVETFGMGFTRPEIDNALINDVLDDTDSSGLIYLDGGSVYRFLTESHNYLAAGWDKQGAEAPWEPIGRLRQAVEVAIPDPPEGFKPTPTQLDEVLKETAPEGYQIDADVDDCADMIDLLNRPAEAQETQEAHVLSVGSSSRARSPPHPRAEPILQLASDIREPAPIFWSADTRRLSTAYRVLAMDEAGDTADGASFRPSRIRKEDVAAAPAAAPAANAAAPPPESPSPKSQPGGFGRMLSAKAEGNKAAKNLKAQATARSAAAPGAETQ